MLRDLGKIAESEIALRSRLAADAEEKARLEQLEVQRRRLDVFAAQMPMSMWICDVNLTCTWASGGSLQALGLHATEMVGLPPERIVPPQHVRMVREAHRRALSGEHTIYDMEWDGRQFRCKVQALEVNGTITGVMGVALDTTEKREAEQNLRQSEARYRTLVELSPDAIIVIGEDHILFANAAAAAMFGAADDGLIGNAHLATSTCYSPTAPSCGVSKPACAD
jgi:PAS domain S-box-containing protein